MKFAGQIFYLRISSAGLKRNYVLLYGKYSVVLYYNTVCTIQYNITHQTIHNSVLLARDEQGPHVST